MGIIPGGRGNDLARVLGIPTETRRRRRRARRRRRRARSTSARSTAAASSGIASSCGFDSDANRIANETQLIKGNLVYLYAALAPLPPGSRRASRSPSTTASAASSRGYSVAAANSKAYGGGMFVAPDAELDDGLLDVVSTASVGKLRFLG